MFKDIIKIDIGRGPYRHGRDEFRYVTGREWMRDRWQLFAINLAKVFDGLLGVISLGMIDSNLYEHLVLDTFDD